MRQTLEVVGEKELSELGKYCTLRSWCCLFSTQSRLCVSSFWAPAVTTSTLVFYIHAF